MGTCALIQSTSSQQTSICWREKRQLMIFPSAVILVRRQSPQKGSVTDAMMPTVPSGGPVMPHRLESRRHT
jgi:hypothetical protein